MKESTLIFYKTKIPSELLSKNDLFAYLEVNEKEQSLLKKWPTKGYTLKQIPKKSGNLRNLYIPNDRLKYLQRKILVLLEKIYTPRYPVHGFTNGKSIISNASAHQRRRYIINLDIEDFFPSISRKRVYGLLRNIGIPKDVSELVCDLTLYGNQLPQGAPTSPILSNMICLKLDKMLLSFCKNEHYRYTRYADDITISSNKYPSKIFNSIRKNFGHVGEEELSENLKSIFSINGFAIKPTKTWFMTSKTRKDVTGLVVNEFVNVRRKYVRNIRSSLHKVETLGFETAQMKFWEGKIRKPDLKENIRGRIMFVGQVKGKSSPVFRKYASKFNAIFAANEDQILIPPTYGDILKKACWVLECNYDNAAGVNIATQGTAVFIEKLGLVTANHVIESIDDYSKIELFLASNLGTKYHVTGISFSCKHHDIAILSHDIPEEVYHELRQPTGNPSKHENVTAVGYPDFGPGDMLNERQMKIVSFPVRKGVNLLEIGGLVSQGMSGGPVINQKHEVYSIISKGGVSERRQISTLVDQLEKVAITDKTEI